MLSLNCLEEINGEVEIKEESGHGRKNRKGNLLTVYCKMCWNFTLAYIFLGACLNYLNALRSWVRTCTTGKTQEKLSR